MQKKGFLYLRLSQFIVMMGKAEIKTPSMDIHWFSQDGARHGRTFNMPTRPPLSSRKHKQLTSTINLLKQAAFKDFPLETQ